MTQILRQRVLRGFLTTPSHYPGLTHPDYFTKMNVQPALVDHQGTPLARIQTDLRSMYDSGMDSKVGAIGRIPSIRGELGIMSSRRS